MTSDAHTDPKLQQALLDPAGAYHSPQALLDDDSLEKDQKIAVLRRWAYDANELAVAEEEGMGGGEDSMLQRVLDALHSLGAAPDIEHSPPTKQRGS